MNKPLYVLTIEDALLAIAVAKKEAESLLPKYVTAKYWVAQKISPEPWLKVMFWYRGQKNYKQPVADAIDALVVLLRCQELLKGFFDTMTAPPPDLTLPKTRSPR